MLKQLRVGTIVTTHGLKGEVKVKPSTEDLDRFLDLEKVYLEPASKGFRRSQTEQRMLEVESVRFHQNMALLKFKGLDRIEDVQNLRNYDLLVDREDAIALPEGEYFMGDLIGVQVITDEGEVLGRVKDILETGANNVFVVARDNGKDLLIPKAPNCVLEMKPEEDYIKVHLLEGLLDL